MPPTETIPETEAEGAPRGSNQSGMRAHNERLVLTLVRQAGALPKSEIARMTGLSVQTASVIMRRLEADGLLRREDPVRGRIGQPSVPMALAAEGAYFLGLKIGRRSSELVLMDFLGKVTAARRLTYDWPMPDPVVAFARSALPPLIATLPPQARPRIAGMGIAMPFLLWQWSGQLGGPGAEMAEWEHRDIVAEISDIAGMPVTVANDATASCGAELIFGNQRRPPDFVYFYSSHFIGGGLVLDGRLHPGRTGNAAALGSMPVAMPRGGSRQLIAVASLATLAALVVERGGDPAPIWDRSENWDIGRPAVEAWLDLAAPAIAQATLATSAVVEIGAAIIDGWMPTALRAELVARVAAAFDGLDAAGLTPPMIQEGSLGASARSMGAATIPLAQRFTLDPAASQLRTG